MTGTVPTALRPFRKLLRAVADLHTRGYQRLRVVPYIYELGTWRCTLLPALYVSRKHGASWIGSGAPECAAHYTTAAGGDYWGWKDNSHSAPGLLAGAILERFPELCRLSYGSDWLYVGWYQEMLHLTYPDALPISWNNQGDDSLDPGMRMVGLDGLVPRSRVIPLPPPGHSVEE